VIVNDVYVEERTGETEIAHRGGTAGEAWPWRGMQRTRRATERERGHHPEKIGGLLRKMFF
jgi:hypothetical protein